VVLLAIVPKINVAYNPITMLSLNCAELTKKSARWLGVCILLAGLPLSVMASIVNEDFGINLNGIDGTGSFSFNTADTTSDGDGPYADTTDGLTSFELTYGGTTYTAPEALDYTTLPAVYLPGNTTVPGGLTYGFLAQWVVSGTCTSTGGGDYTCAGPGGVGGATIVGVGRNPQAYLYEDVTSASIDFTGSYVTYAFGTDPTKIYGTITGETVAPEPAVIPVLALGLGGLLFARRRSRLV
jgi:hypothetical protein